MVLSRIWQFLSVKYITFGIFQPKRVGNRMHRWNSMVNRTTTQINRLNTHCINRAARTVRGTAGLCPSMSVGMPTQRKQRNRKYAVQNLAFHQSKFNNSVRNCEFRFLSGTLNFAISFAFNLKRISCTSHVVQWHIDDIEGRRRGWGKYGAMELQLYDRHLQIPDRGDYGCSKTFNFARKFAQSGEFSAPNVVLLEENSLRQE